MIAGVHSRWLEQGFYMFCVRSENISEYVSHDSAPLVMNMQIESNWYQIDSWCLFLPSWACPLQRFVDFSFGWSFQSNFCCMFGVMIHMTTTIIYICICIIIIIIIIMIYIYINIKMII